MKAHIQSRVPQSSRIPEPDPPANHISAFENMFTFETILPERETCIIVINKALRDIHAETQLELHRTLVCFHDLFCTTRNA
jgi:hypothetical protein